MKVGILTVPTAGSFGASLQLFALYTAVRKMGADAEVVHYQNEYMKAERHMKVANDKRLKKMLRRALHYRQIRAFRNFEKCMVKYPARPIHQKEKLVDAVKRYDAVITGSDQVWNPDITGSDLSYFLDFCGPETKRIAYAPSFGHDQISAEFRREIENELKLFRHLSVREAEGQAILWSLISKEVPLVMDPSFLLTREEWMTNERKHDAASEPYILYYTVRSSKSLMDFCMRLAEERNMKVVLVGGNCIRRLKNKDCRIDYAYDLEPREWLYLLHHAECVVTNSFHGTAFSVNYQKEFYVEFSSLTNSRLTHIIRTLGLEDRVVRDGNCLMKERIDYSTVGKIVAQLCKKSTQYLSEAVMCK